MGENLINTSVDRQMRADFIRHLLDDIEALELMVQRDLIEDDVMRIGAEQEFCLVDENWRPAKGAIDFLKEIGDGHFTTELAQYNVEINADPICLEGPCFSNMEQHIYQLLLKASELAEKQGRKIVLTGILPTISKNELGIDFMSPAPRYIALNERMKALRGSDFTLHIRGVDELSINHDSVLFEACNTSFQMHLQIPAHDFISSYNWAQAITGPFLGIAANSPLLLGRELWSETRIALFQQSIDTRSSSYALSDQLPRVTFGNRWAEGNVADIFKHDVALYKALVTKPIEQNSLQELEAGNIPRLQALSLHNGTIYRWNRPCYGITNGKPHLRIENRYVPAGPSLLDEMANFAFWVGMLAGRPAEYDDMARVMDFKDAKGNFIKTARTGKEAVLHWKGRQISVRDLVLDELLPLAYEGLKKLDIDTADIHRYLTVIEERTMRNTGSQWLIRNYRLMRKSMKQDDALLALTKAMHEHQCDDKAVHKWPNLETRPSVHEAAHVVGHIMSTQLFTVNENDLARLATSVMQWKNIHHLPVEKRSGELSGLLTWTHMKRFRERDEQADGRIVADIMTSEVLTVSPTTEIETAIRLMKKHEYGCLPVVDGDELVGIVTIKDVIQFDHA